MRIEVNGRTIESDSAAAAIEAAIRTFGDAELGIEPDVELVREWATREAQGQAEVERGMWITLLPGKVGEYTQKREEFLAWDKAGRPAPTDTDYPIAVAEARSYEIDPAQLLAIWGQRAAQWNRASGAIAEIERKALLLLEAARTVKRIAEILSRLSWPSQRVASLTGATPEEIEAATEAIVGELG